MESPRKFNDCYFYYYSTCTKGDNCVFRHEPSALGCETMCAAWQQGKCLNKRCELRHMELRKNRKQIACYWENQPGGCRKKHCPFMHKNPDARTDGIAPSQPAPPVPTQPTVSASEPIPMEQQPLNPGVPPAVAPQPLPLLWQQQRQVLDSALLGVLPPHELLPRRGHEPTPYALPVDPLVVNFDEESDNETPSSTPTKTVSPEEATKVARTKSQELLLLEKIQAEAAAFYSYESLPEPPKARANLSTKYDRLSLDELAGKQATERRTSLDFKIMSLDEIRAKKKADTIVQPTPITINLSRKRKLSTQEALTTTGNKIIKVIRSNSIVYKKVDKANEGKDPKQEQSKNEESTARKRTLSEQCNDIYDFQEAELVDDCHEFKKIKIDEQMSKPRLIRNLSSSSKDYNDSRHEDQDDGIKTDNDTDTEVQIVGVSSSDVTDIDIIDIDSTKLGDPVDIVDLSEYPDDEVVISDEEITLVNVPDVVASCRKSINRTESVEQNLLNDIDSLLNDDL